MSKVSKLITKNFPAIPGDSIKTSDIAILTSGEQFYYILQQQVYPGSSMDVVSFYDFPECVDTANCE